MKEPWYRNGLCFSCQRCGKCCYDEGEYTEVYVDDEDIERMADHMKIVPREFRKRYVKRSDGFTVLRSRGVACILLSRGRCRAYPDHPKQCRTWPFWPRNLSRHVWYGEVKKRCPGVGRGRRYSVSEIEQVLTLHTHIP